MKIQYGKFNDKLMKKADTMGHLANTTTIQQPLVFN
jgi:hypothetical protein